jgi:hypothetical protein
MRAKCHDDASVHSSNITFITAIILEVVVLVLLIETDLWSMLLRWLRVA